MEALGRHFLIELFGCNKATLDNVEKVEDILMEAAIRSKATIIKSSFHHFNPHGVSGMIIIAESHLSVHTWPEYGYIAADIFTCGKVLNPEKGIECMVENFEASYSSITEIKRGWLQVPKGKLLENMEVI